MRDSRTTPVFYTKTPIRSRKVSDFLIRARAPVKIWGRESYPIISCLI
uniref:Uncharacterized protein n=1 Tax=Arundo donax TaxID=35708 RepID=A0A0A9BZG2_ARUDO